jgi:hypothetical protein
MKNAGMPDSDAEKPNGSGGVSADGEGARGPLRCAPGAPLGPAAGLALALERRCVLGEAPEELCGRCERTTGAAPAGGAGFGVVDGSTVSVGAVSVVCVGVLVLVVPGGGVAALAVPEAPGCAARLPDGSASPSASASAAVSANRERLCEIAGLIASLSCRGGS